MSFTAHEMSLVVLDGCAAFDRVGGSKLSI